MKKKKYLTPEIETTVLAYEDIMFVFSGNAPDTDDSEDFDDGFDFGF